MFCGMLLAYGRNKQKDKYKFTHSLSVFPSIPVSVCTLTVLPHLKA